MTEISLVSTLIQAGIGGAVILVVTMFLKHLREERIARDAESMRRDAEFTKRNDKTCEVMTENNNKVCEALSENTKSLTILATQMLVHDERIKPVLPLVSEVLEQVKPVIPILITIPDVIAAKDEPKSRPRYRKESPS